MSAVHTDLRLSLPFQALRWPLYSGVTSLLWPLKVNNKIILKILIEYCADLSKVPFQCKMSAWLWPLQPPRPKNLYTDFYSNKEKPGFTNDQPQPKHSWALSKIEGKGRLVITQDR